MDHLLDISLCNPFDGRSSNVLKFLLLDEYYEHHFQIMYYFFSFDMVQIHHIHTQIVQLVYEDLFHVTFSKIQVVVLQGEG